MRNARSPHVLPSLRLLGLLGAIWSGLSACDAPPAATPPPPDAGEAGVSACQDPDEDGFGPGCESGFDCAPEDPEVGNECLGCTSPETGCPCDDGTEAIDCVLDPVEVGDVTMCYAGTRHCRDGVWSSCAALRSYTLPDAAPSASSGAAIESLVSGPEACPNPCDPLCRVSRDTPGPGDITPGSGLIYTPSPGGITLEPDPTSGTPTLPDADGDGVPDAYDSAPTNPSITGHESGFFAVLPYGTTATRSRDIATTVRTVDVYFLVDTTGSMGGEIANLRTSLSGTIIPGIRAAIPDAWFGVGRHDDYPVSPYGGAAYGDRVFQHLQDITSDTTLAQNAVNGLATRWGNDLPESQTQALWAVATGGGIGTYLTASSGIGRNAGGAVVTSGIARTGCPTGRWGYPCFREGTIPIVILVTDVGYHNGPHTPWDYASTAGGILAPGPAQVVPAPFFPQPAPTAISHRTSYPLPTPPLDITHWEGWTPGSTAPISHVTTYDAPATATPITHASLIAVPTPPVDRTHATGGSTGTLPPSWTDFSHSTSSTPSETPRGVTHGTTSTYGPPSPADSLPHTVAATVNSNRSVTHGTATPGTTEPTRTVSHAPFATVLPNVTPVDHQTWSGPAPGSTATVPSPAEFWSSNGTRTGVSVTVGSTGRGDVISNPILLGDASGATTAPSVSLAGSNFCAARDDYRRNSDGLYGSSSPVTSGSRYRDVVFRFNVPLGAGGTYRICTQWATRHNWALFNDPPSVSGTDITSAAIVYDGSVTASALECTTVTLTENRNYLLIVENWSSSTCGTGTFLLDVQRFFVGRGRDRGTAVPARVPSSTAYDDSTLNLTPGGDNVASDVAVSLTGNTTGGVDQSYQPWYGRDQYIRFRLSSPRRVQISLSSTTINTAWRLWRPDGSIVRDTCNPVSAIGADMCELDLGAGDYIVGVDAINGTTVIGFPYTLTIRPGNYPHDYIWSARNAGDLTNVGASFSGRLLGLSNDDSYSFAGSDAFYSFTLFANRTVRLSLEAGDYCDGALTVRNTPNVSAAPIAQADDRFEGCVWTEFCDSFFWWDCWWECIGGGRPGLEVQLTGSPTGTTYYVGVEGATGGDCLGASVDYVLDIEPNPVRASGGANSWGCYGSTGWETAPCFSSADAGGAAGETFGSAVSLGDLTNTSRSVTGITGEASTRVDGGMSNEYGAHGSCTANGADAVYRFQLTEARDVFLSTARSTGISGDGFTGGFNTVLGLYGPTPTPSASPPFVACDNNGAGVYELSRLPSAGTRRLEAGWYYVVVDGTSSGGDDPRGNFRLDIGVSNGASGDTDVAGNVIEVGNLVGRNVSYSATGTGTCSLTANYNLAAYSASCPATTSGQDAVYRFTLSEARLVSATVSNLGATAPRFVIRRGTTLAAGTTIAPSSGAACGDAASAVTWDLPATAAGEFYYLVIDAASSGCGAYSLSLNTQTLARIGDTRLTAFELEAGVLPDLTDTNRSWATVSGSDGTCTLTNGENQPTCGGSGNPDAYYGFRLTAPRRITLSLSQAAVNGLPNPVIAIYDGAGNQVPNDGAAVACATGATSAALSWNLGIGTYFAVVDSAASSGRRCGDYTLVYQTARVRGDDVGTVVAINALGSLDAAGANVSASGFCALQDSTWTPLRSDVITATCGGAGAGSGSRDAVYSFTLSQRRTITVTATGTAAVTIRRAGDPTTELSSTVGSTCLTTGTRSWDLDPGGATLTYYLVVEGGASGACADYSLSISSAGITSRVGDLFTSAGGEGYVDVGDTTSSAFFYTAGSTCDLTDQFSSCGVTGGRDAFYSFTLTAPRDVTITLAARATTPGYNPTFHLATVSGSTFTPYASSPSCADATGAGGSESRTFTALPGSAAGGGTRYFVVVDSGSVGAPTCGDYTLAIRTSATTVAGDTYANARDVLPAPTAIATATATTGVWYRATNLCSIGDDIASSCSTLGANRRDGVFRFRLDVPARVTVNVRNVAAGFDPVVSIRDNSGTPAEMPGVTGASCINAATAGSGETITATLPAGTYYAVVDSADGSCGTYDIQIQPQTLGTVIGDTQTSAILMPNLTAASTSFRGTSTCDLADDYTSACSTAGPARRDAVYRFRIDSPRRVLATLTPRTAGFNAILELRDSTFALVSPCVDGAGAGPTGIETLSVASLPTGDYFLVVDSDDGSCGDYQIDVQTGSPSGLGDTYGTAIPSGGLDLTGMGASYMAGSTCDLAHDIAPATCGVAGVAGRDAVYQFTLTAPRIVTARLTGLSPGFDGVLSIRNLSGVEVAGACADANGAGGNESLTVTLPGSTGGTTYYVVVDSDTPAGCGNYRVELSSAAVLGDTLATAIVTSLSSGAASVSGNTGTPAGLTNDALTPCSTGSGAGVDAFYRFQVPDARRVTLSARGSTWDLALGLRTATTILGCSATGVAGAVQTVVADLVPGVDYYALIDGRVAGAAGAYQLDISTARVQGDTILTAIPAGNLTMASASFQGIGSGTMGLANDFATCGTTDGAGPDAFYAFSLTAPRRITVTLTPASGYNASLAIRDGAGAIVTGTCTNVNPAGVAETWTGILPSGDYTVQVDGDGTSSGRFQLDIASRSDLGDVRLDPVDAGNLTGRSESYSGTTVGLANDEVPSCGLAGSPDAFYSFFLTQPTFLQIDTFGSGTDTVLALYNATTGAALGCNDNTGAGTESSLAGSLAAGTYMVLLEHRSTAGAAYRLNFRTRTPDNERIATPYNVGNLTAASANVDGNTCQMASDFASVDRTCGTAGSGTGGDTVFTFTLDTTRSIVIDTVGSEFDTVLRLTNSAGGDIACDDNGGGGAGASRIAQTLASGTYFVILDSYGSECGNYHLNFDVVGGTSSGFPTIPWGSAVSALNARDIDVIVVSSMGSYDTRSRTDADALCDATGTVRSVASCPTGQTLCFSGTGCCVGSVLRGSSTRFRYDINEDGSGLGSAVVEAVQNLSQYRRLDLTAVPRDNPTTVGFDERSFVSSITAVSFPAGRCTGISGGTRFLGCLPGTTVNFRANFIGAVMPTMVTQVFTFNIEVLGDDSIVLAVVPVTIVVPPIGPLYPSPATYTRDFDGDAGCPTGSTALPVWRDLRWTATLPAGTSIGWTVRSATTVAGLATAGPSTFTTPSEVSPVMLQARLMGSGQPTNARYLRVSATLNPSAAGDVAPTLTNMEVTWSCLPSE